MPPKTKIKRSAFSVGNSSANPNRTMAAAKINGGMARTKNTINVLNMYKNGKAIRNKKGVVVGGQFLMKSRAGGAEITSATGRVAPDRRWFGNTRVVGQAELDRFREEMSVKAADPYSVILRRKKLPMGLLIDAKAKCDADGSRSHLLEVESFEDTFAGGRARKRPKISAPTLDALVAKADAAVEKYGEDSHSDRDRVGDADSMREGRRHDLFMKGQSKRIWAELYKVIDSSDVLLMVLDARNVPGTRCVHLETYLRKHASHKNLVFILNKCDLVPTWVTRKWVQQLSLTVPTLAFHASMGNPFGKGALINLLRQFSKLHADKKAISVGVVGYPNVGKSSIINTLRAKKVCKTAPVPGETKVWQYISLMKRISLVDCPGIVYDTGDSETDTVLKGVVRAERLPDPTEYVGAILERSRKEHVQRTYGLEDWDSPEDFMTQLAKRNGRLIAGGEPDFNTVAVQVINDWQRGKLPFFVPPPEDGPEDSAAAVPASADSGTGEDALAADAVANAREHNRADKRRAEDCESDASEFSVYDEEEDEAEAAAAVEQAELEADEEPGKVSSAESTGHSDDEAPPAKRTRGQGPVTSMALDWDDL